MPKDLTNSAVERQNILNNQYALHKAAQYLDLGGVEFQGEQVFTKQQVSKLFAISDSTIERYLATYDEELKGNGYVVLKGQKLKEFKSLVDAAFIHEGHKVSVLGLFTFRAVLNLAMLLTESERARQLRSRLLDIVLDVLAEKTGGQTKYINQRDEQYLLSAYQEEGYRRQFTDALKHHVDAHNFKYAHFTNLIYQSIFCENAREYRQVLKLAVQDRTRETMYSEVLNLIASYESGVAHEIEQAATKLGRQLTLEETEALFASFEAHPLFKPLILDARTKMASRDLCFRDALHQRLEAYVQSVPQTDFEKFLGKTSKALEERLSDPETLAVFKRLKDR